jgi:hypothetical protein
MRQRHLISIADNFEMIIARSRRETIGGRTCNAGCDDSCVCELVEIVGNRL